MLIVATTAACIENSGCFSGYSPITLLFSCELTQSPVLLGVTIPGPQTCELITYNDRSCPGICKKEPVCRISRRQSLCTGVQKRDMT